MGTTTSSLNLRKIRHIALVWMLISCFQVFYDSLVVQTYLENTSVYRFWHILMVNAIIALIAGATAGLVLTKMEAWIRTMPFWKAIFYISLIYTVLGVLLIALGSTFYQIITKQASPLSAEVQQGVASFMFSADFLKQFLTWGLVMIGTIIVLAVNDKYGQGNFRDMLAGRYFQPSEEERIFMFLDIKGSTTIAEQIGAKKYFYLLQDFFEDATLPILQTKGEIYQYVGDEIIISWRMNNGIEQANCIECFYAIQNAILTNQERYMEKYNCIPIFKAGLHYGKVMVGEMGRVKKEITFSGDVLNTASRIQMECNKRNVPLLASDKLLSILSLPAYMTPKSLGDIELRGKSEKVNMSTILLNY